MNLMVGWLFIEEHSEQWLRAQLKEWKHTHGKLNLAVPCPKLYTPMCMPSTPAVYPVATIAQNLCIL